MLFDFNQPTDLLTPIFHPDGVNKINPILTSRDAYPLDENDVQFSSISSKNMEYQFATKDNLNENSDNNQQQDDLLSTFELPALSELDGFSFERYLTQSSSALDAHDSFISDDSTFLPMDESTSPWVARECTVESEATEDMIVPPSPPLSITSSTSSSIVERRTTKKRSFSTTERKLRKKDQNKTAAEKYRLKKRSERNDINSRHADLKHQNQELKHQLENLSFRLDQFKQLVVDVLQIPIPPTKSNE